MKNKKTILLILLTLVYQLSSFAQCAMCKSTASSDLDNGGNIGNGLNTGIYILMGIPYVLLSVGGYFFFKKQIDAKLMEWKEKIFSPKKA